MLELLKQLGLGEKEARIYLALLESGGSLVSGIAQKAGVNRTTCYDILEKLIKYNLITHSSGTGSRKKFSPLSPIYLVQLLERRQKAQGKKLEELKEKLPELQGLYKTVDKPGIKFLEGDEGLKTIYQETLQTKGEILSIGDVDAAARDHMREWVRQYNRERARKKIYERILIPPSPTSIEWFTHYPADLRYTQYRVLPPNRFPLFNGEVTIFDDKVIIIILKLPHRLGVCIQSGHFAHILRALYEMAWEAAAKYGPTYPLKKKDLKTINAKNN